MLVHGPHSILANLHGGARPVASDVSDDMGIPGLLNSSN